MFKKFSSINGNSANRYEFLKIISLAASFFFIIASYSILRPLKTSIFFSLVGREYQPIAKFFTISLMIPIMLLYSKLVDRLKRSYLVHLFLILYSLLAIVFAFLLRHPVIGLSNTATNPGRLIGWFFYLYMDMYSPLILSTFWAFANSINSPANAKKSYGKIVAFSRIGGIIAPILAWFLINRTSLDTLDVIPILIITTSVFLTLSSFSIFNFTKKVPKNYLSSYESKQLKKSHIKKKKPKTGIFEGLKLMIKQPYVFGLFSLVYIYEVISVVLDYQMQVLISIANNNQFAGMSSYMFLYTSAFQALGFIFAFGGTSSLLKRFDVSKCLMITPISIAIAMIVLLLFPSVINIFAIMIFLRGMHYGFNTPVREILYIPTVKDIKFKSKSWIDSFGRTFAKSSGSAFNLLAQTQTPAMFLKLDSLFSLGLTMIWSVASLIMGRKYSKTIKNNEIIGVKAPEVNVKAYTPPISTTSEEFDTTVKQKQEQV